MGDSATWLRIAIWVVPVLFAVTVHEVAHGWVARLLGDPPAAARGRLSLNPLRHIDPVGTLLVPALLLAFGGLILGWARPVPVVAANLRRPRRDMALVAAAGPAANMAMALAWALVTRAGFAMAEPIGLTAVLLGYVGVAGMVINIVLMVINLVPVPPLDGGRVLVSLLPPGPARLLSRVEPFGLLLLLALLATRVLGDLVGPPIMSILGLLAMVAGVPPGLFDRI